jgi:hypothetical protein
MSEGFQHAIAGGQGKLIISQLQSPNFELSPLTGWAVLKNGQAYFADVTVSGSFMGTSFEINSAGAFFYSGTPALGNLVASIASANGTDPYGNAYFQTFNVGDQQGAHFGIDGSGNVFLVNSSGKIDAEIRSDTGAYLIYNASGGGAGNLAISVVPGANTVTDPYGNTAQPGVTSYASSTFWAQLLAGVLNFATTGTFTNATFGSNVPGAAYMSSGAAVNTDTIAEVLAEAPSTSGLGGRLVELIAEFVQMGVGGTGTVTILNNCVINGTLSVNGSTDTSTDGLPNGGTQGTSSSAGLTDGTIHGTSGAQSAGTAHTHGPGSFAVGNGQHTHGPGSYSVTNGMHSHTL